MLQTGVYETVIFDLDGTLLDTLDDLTAATNAALSAFGYPLRTRDEVRAFVGNGIRKLVERALGEAASHTEEALAVFKQYYAAHCADRTKAYPDIVLLLSELRRRGVSTAVVSNKADFAVKTLAKAYFGELLTEAIGENEGAGIRRKPAPDSLLAVMRRLGARPETTVYVGDSDVDIATAKNANVDHISVTWGFRDRAFLEAHGGEKFVDTPLALLRYVRSAPFCEAGIGNTPIVELTGIENACKTNARIFAKCEQYNAGGSVKDRAAQAIIEAAERNGSLRKGGCIVEATSGNTGIGLALVARARGYRAVIVMPSNMSEERRRKIEECGGEVVLTDGAAGMSGAVAQAKALAESLPNAVYADQFRNPACVQVHYERTAAELWRQSEGTIDVFAACVGCGGTLTGIGRFLKEKDRHIRVYAIEPSASPLLSEGHTGKHGIQGIGADFIPEILDRTVYDGVIAVSDEEALRMARWLRETDGLFVGISSGAAVAAALRLSKLSENAGKRIWTILPDDGDRYLSIL